ncbi:Molybdopterin synthase catalytic subunit [Tsuneonella dongtanensis]|uniref:Molybdopterin synthase catalytic subunit n=1 Tax=Tsuneonella dongtanensis TaxID=692370 RepID=A0A1B2AC25_9SPHN|nr:molybdenum cofactor biosynthesis protein MoaE [Tsuneonella dongtanensis]ANY19644.1 Molybdopterin synthase catalytic subunit [Tsuneonella dongtanensis]
MTVEVELAGEPFAPADLLARFTAGLRGEGAVVSFSGHARGTSKDGNGVDALVLESYRGMTLRSMQDIAAAAMDRFEVTRCLVVHRAGRILPGEAIVFVATASAHRRAAFEAADYLMDRLKTEAVFWKREESADGDRWIEPTDADHADARRWTDER